LSVYSSVYIALSTSVCHIYSTIHSIKLSHKNFSKFTSPIFNENVISVSRLEAITCKVGRWKVTCRIRS